ncbi:MAG: acyl-CoA dehydrogenase family protein [Hyphomicrobiaceae bacterium]|nr:acyl-CoA dehydrogenase family protein [Hyphomicrobiaceae bacterium]
MTLAVAKSELPASGPQRLAAIAEKLAALGARYDAVPMFPADSVKLLVGAGLHKTFAPLASGGDAFETPRAQNAALLDTLRVVGRADLSVGRIFEGHVNALKLFDWYGTPAQKHRLARDLRDGKMFGVWATEQPPGVTIQTNGAGWALSGKKSFATGAGSLDYAIITAKPEGAERRMVIAQAGEARRADLSGWRVRGMRATVSGSYDFSGLRLEQADLLGEPGQYDREPRFTAGAWRFTAVQLGGIEALLTETRAAMSDAARADVLHRAKFGAAVVATRTAYLWVREAAQRAADEDDNAIAFSQMTRGVVERAALDVMELAARIVGTRSAFEGQRIDKIIRDLSLYLRQAGPDYARDQAAQAWLDHDAWGAGDALW